MQKLAIVLGFVVANIIFAMGYPQYAQEQVSAPPPDQPIPTETRGLFYDFYKERVTPTTVIVQVPSGSPVPDEDAGDKIALGVVKTTVTLADSGLQIAQDILKTVQSEILEAFRPDHRTAPYA